MSSSQLKKLESAIKSGAKVILNLSSNVTGNCNDETNFLHGFLLTNTPLSKFRKSWLNKSSANLKLSKAQLHKIGRSGGFISRLSWQLLKVALALIGNVLKLLAKSVLMSWGLIAAASTTDGAILKFVKKVNAIDSSGIVEKADFDANLNEIKGEIPSIPNLATITNGNPRGSRIKDETSGFTGLAATTAPYDNKNNIPNVIAFVKKADYDTKIDEIEKKSFIINIINILPLNNFRN